MRMNNNQQVIIDFETKQGTSAMYIVFKHLFSKWQSTAEDNIFIEKTKLDDLFRNQLRKDPTENTVKSTISNIRKRIRDKNLQNNVEITYDKKKQGYNFRIHNPFRSS
jgi:transcription elongation factor GreA-like protein